MTADPGAYDVTPPDADDFADDARIERDQEIRVLGAPADYLTPGEFEAAIERNRARRGVFASVPHTTAVDMVSAAMDVVSRPRLTAASPVELVDWQPVLDALVAWDEARDHGLERWSAEDDRLQGVVFERLHRARGTWRVGGDAA
jgi:hypothetical protein